MRIVLIGEAMLELSQRGEAWHLGHGGDTLNTALHLARMGHDVAYLTALGRDPFSMGLCDRWRAEGLDTALVLHTPTARPGFMPSAPMVAASAALPIGATRAPRGRCLRWPKRNGLWNRLRRPT